jgi:hypothetical protein
MTFPSCFELSWEHAVGAFVNAAADRVGCEFDGASPTPLA